LNTVSLFKALTVVTVIGSWPSDELAVDAELGEELVADDSLPELDEHPASADVNSAAAITLVTDFFFHECNT